MVGINQVLKMAWSIISKTVDDKTSLQALALINDCNKYKMDLTTNGVIITDAIKFVEANKDKLRPIEEESGNKSIEYDNDTDEGKNQLDERQEEGAGEIDQKLVTNKVF
jgi:hypothetical protein